MGMKESIGGEFLLGISSIDTHSVTYARVGGCVFEAEDLRSEVDYARVGGCVFEGEEDLRSEVDWIGGVLGP
jgi:hypothetical protein